VSGAAVVTMTVAIVVLFGGLLASVALAVVTTRRDRDRGPD
jgi:hypothetical protein